MLDRHVDFWPRGLPRHLTLPQTNLFTNLEVSSTRYPDKPAVVFYDSPMSYAALKEEVERVAGYLEHACGIRQGDRVLLYMQNSPQFIIAYYAILRANAVVVPVNPMNLTEELRHYVSDTGASTIDGGTVSNRAVTARAWLMITVHVAVVTVHAPLHPTNL